jgi:peptidylprolyl isomerase
MSKKAFWVILGVLVLGLIYALFFSGNKTATESKNMDTNIVTESGKLIIEDIKAGEGREIKSGDTVVIHYTGTLENGTKFDSSVDRGQPFTTQIGVGQVIKGWDEGVPGMKVGGKRKLVIPPDLAYGDRAIGSIPPNSTLIFEVELLEIK